MENLNQKLILNDSKSTLNLPVNKQSIYSAKFEKQYKTIPKTFSCKVFQKSNYEEEPVHF